MSFASEVMRRSTFCLLKNQLAIIFLVAIIFIIIYDLSAFLASIYGGLIALLATLISSWRITRAGNLASIEKQQSYTEIFLGAFQKYILVLVLFAIGMGYLDLFALAMIVSFALAQVAYIFIEVDPNYQSISKFKE